MGGYKPSRNRVIVPARQATLAGGIHSFESIPGLCKHLKIGAQLPHETGNAKTTCHILLFASLCMQRSGCGACGFERAEPVFLNDNGAQESIPRHQFRLCSLAGRYDNPIPTRCLAPVDF
jgi:hypothetical protein